MLQSVKKILSKFQAPLKRLAFKATEGIVFGIGLVLAGTACFFVYAYSWTNLSDTNTSGTQLSSTMWNNLVDNVNYLSGQVAGVSGG